MLLASLFSCGYYYLVDFTYSYVIQSGAKDLENTNYYTKCFYTQNENILMYYKNYFYTQNENTWKQNFNIKWFPV